MSGERYIKAAYSYLYIRDFDQAMHAFRCAIEAEPENASYYFHGAVTALRNNLLEVALDWAEQAARFAPNNALYREHVDVVKSAMLVRDATIAVNEGDAAQAHRLLSEALERDPLNDTAHEFLQKLGSESESRNGSPKH